MVARPAPHAHRPSRARNRLPSARGVTVTETRRRIAQAPAETFGPEVDQSSAAAARR